MNIRPGNLVEPEEWTDFLSMIESRSEEENSFTVDLSATQLVDLSVFNLLLMTHVAYRRKNKQVTYIHCEDESLKNLTSKTNFDYVFVS